MVLVNMKEIIKISERERKCLEVLVYMYKNEANCMYFSYIARQADLDVRQTRIAVRSLVRKGLAEYVRGLFDDEGMVAGSGHCATQEGVNLIEI